MIVHHRIISILGCATALLLSHALMARPENLPESQAESQFELPSLSEVPDGEHYYVGHSVSELSDTPRLLLSKWGRVVVGIDARSSSSTVCFKGFVEGYKIVNATRVLPPYRPDSQWDYQPGEMLNLGQYEEREPAPTEEEVAAFSTCLDVFSR